MPEQDILGQQLTGNPDTTAQSLTVLADAHLAFTVAKTIHADLIIVGDSGLRLTAIQDVSNQGYLGQQISGAPDLDVTTCSILANAKLQFVTAKHLRASLKILASTNFAATAGPLTLPIPTRGMSISVSRRAVQRSFS